MRNPAETSPKREKKKLSLSFVCRCQKVSLKIAYNNPYMDERVDKYSPFKRELFFHRDLMPKIEELLLSVDDNTKLTKK
jgi:hypothetical protein